MKAAFHYLVKSKRVDYKSTNKIDFVEYEQVFENENPIIAREKAFSHYQSIIDVLLQGKGKTYESDKQVRKYLKSYIDSATSTKIKIGDKEIELSDSIGYGIGIFFIIDNPIKGQHESIRDNEGDEWLIHGIGSLGGYEDPQTLMDGLFTEFSYYENYKYDTKDYKRIVSFYEYDIDETDTNEILETPFDWVGYDKPYSGN